jgi:putative addiction module antidote
MVITMVELKVRKFGNSLGVILPKEALQHLNATEGQRLLLIESPDGAFQLRASDPELELQMKIAREGMARYRNALRVLAK